MYVLQGVKNRRTDPIAEAGQETRRGLAVFHRQSEMMEGPRAPAPPGFCMAIGRLSVIEDQHQLSAHFVRITVALTHRIKVKRQNAARRKPCPDSGTNNAACCFRALE